MTTKFYTFDEVIAVADASARAYAETVADTYVIGVEFNRQLYPLQVADDSFAADAIVSDLQHALDEHFSGTPSMSYDDVAEKIKRHARELNRVIVSIVANNSDVLLIVEASRKKSTDKITEMPDQSSAIIYAEKLRDELVDDFEYVKNVVISARKRVSSNVESVDYVLVSGRKGVPHITLGKLNRIYLKGDFGGHLGITPGSHLIVGYNAGEDSIAIHKTKKDAGTFRVADRMYITAARLFNYCEFNERFRVDEVPRTYYLDAATGDSSVAIFRAD